MEELNKGVDGRGSACAAAVVVAAEEGEAARMTN
jgi:hypothetical protein